MNFDKFEALVSVMTNEQYVRFETAVFNLMKEDCLFSRSEIITMEKKIQGKKKLEVESLLVASN
jgi:hypothetical protein